MAFMQITVLPLGTASPSVGRFVAEIEQFLQTRGIEHRLHDMGTVVCGEVEFLLDLARQLHAIPFSSGARRVITQVTIDERCDIERQLGDKTRAVLSRQPEEHTHEE